MVITNNHRDEKCIRENRVNNMITIMYGARWVLDKGGGDHFV